jgi:hypothetical protein
MVIRPSQRTDAHSISHIYVQTWQDTYLSVVPYTYLLEMSVDQQEKSFYDELKSGQIASFIASMLVRVLKHNPCRLFYSKINGTYLKTVRMPFAGEVMDVEIYGWLDASLTWQ